MNDKPTTFFERAQNDLDEPAGRYAKSTTRPTVTGTTPFAQMPEAADWCSAASAVPGEPNLGMSVNYVEPTGEPFEIEHSLRQPPPPAEDADGPGADSDGGSSSPTVQSKLPRPPATIRRRL
jgi:hypothetical protein